MWLLETGAQTNQYLYKYLVESNRELYQVLSEQPPWLSLSLHNLILTMLQAETQSSDRLLTHLSVIKVDSLQQKWM